MVGVSNFHTIIMADLVRVKEKFQVTIPVELRRRLAVHEGDYLEATIMGDGIVFRPKSLVSTSAKRPMTILDFLSEPIEGGRTRVEIDAALKADRDSWDK